MNGTDREAPLPEPGEGDAARAPDAPMETPAPAADAGVGAEARPPAVEAGGSAEDEARPEPPDAAAAPAAATPPEPVAAAPPAEPTPREPAGPSPPRPPRRARPRWRDRLAERPEPVDEVPRSRLAAQSRRNFLLFGAGLLGAAVAAWWLLPDRAKSRLLPAPARERLDTLAARVGLTRARRERALDEALTFDDDVAEALYSKDRRVRTYDPSQVTPLRNNYTGQTPGPEYLATWALRVSGLASGRTERLTIADLRKRFAPREECTRLVCVEGWSAIARWRGIAFADFLAAFPPAPTARWAAMRSAVNLDEDGDPDPYYVSIDLDTARHPQTLLATHLDGRPLTLGHGAPLRLVAPMKLGLKNIKAITSIEYTAGEPPDYWNERGYSKYDGL